MDIKVARDTIASALKDDPGFRQGYQANIAMLIYDTQISKKPLKLDTVEGCNIIADKLIKLIFE